MKPTTTTVSLSALETDVTSVGSGPPLLMIQGLGTDQRAWQPVVDHLASEVRCITYDNRGVGSASKVGDEPLSVDDLAVDAAEVIESLDDGPVHVCGVSLGGGIAMRLAARYPELVRSLALHATTARPDPRLLAILDFRMQLVDRGFSADLLRTFVALFAWSPTEMHIDLPEGAADMGRVSDDDYMQFLRAATEQYMEDEELGNITAPTLVVCGDEDILTPPDHSRALHEAIPNSRLLTVAGGGHAYYAEDPQFFAAMQGGWVRGNA